MKRETKEIDLYPYPVFEMIAESDFVANSFGTSWERQTLTEWAQYLTHFNSQGTPYTVLDVGAYTGIYALMAANYGWNAHVHAFEPHPDVCRRLGENIHMNLRNLRLHRPLNSLRCHNYALSNENTMAEFEITGGSPLPSGSSLAAHPDKAPLRTVTVEVKKLDDVLLTGGNVKLVKIDVERHELAVLEGMDYILEWFAPVMFIEILTPEDFVKIREYLSEFPKYKAGSITQIDDNPLYSGPRNKVIGPDEVPEITEFTTNFIFST